MGKTSLIGEELAHEQKTDRSLQLFTRNLKVIKPVLMAGVPGSLGSSPDHLVCLEEVGDLRWPEGLQARMQNCESSLHNVKHLLAKVFGNVMAGALLRPPD